jgi:hypothetical protein
MRLLSLIAWMFVGFALLHLLSGDVGPSDVVLVVLAGGWLYGPQLWNWAYSRAFQAYFTSEPS